MEGIVLQGPVGYTPQCNCLPAMYRLEKQMNDTKDHVYGHMHTTQQAMQERLDKLDQRSSLRVQTLEQYTRDRFTEEEHMCQQRISQKMTEQESHYMNQNDKMKLQIQDWLEEKLEGYGHCLHHHHDDSVLPNENIFSDVHETANGRLFKSRSDETLSQSDNHSGKFRKRDFYESRTAAMQQMRAWQVPSYSKDRNKVQVRTDPQKVQRSQSKQHISQTEQRRYYPLEPEVEVRNPVPVQDKRQASPAQIDRKSNQKMEEESEYVTMNRLQHGAVPKQTQGIRKSQSYQPQRPATRGPVNHSTPKGGLSSNYDSISAITRSNTDSGLNKRVLGDSHQQTLHQSDPSSSLKPRLPDRPAVPTQQGTNRQLVFHTSEQEYSPHVSSSPVKNSPSANFRNSVSSDKIVSDNLPKPTFTTFGYDGDTTDGRQAPANSPNQKTDRENHMPEPAQSVNTPRTNSDTNFTTSSPYHSTAAHSSLGLHESQNSFGFVPSPGPAEDNYVDMSFSSRSQRLHQRARSADGLLDNDEGFARNRDMPSPYFGGSPYALDSTRSSSVPRSMTGLNVSNSPSSKSVPEPQVKSEPVGYPRSSSHSIYSANSSTTSPMSYKTTRVPPPTSPKPKVSSQIYSSYSTVRDVQNNSSRYRGSPSVLGNTSVNSATDNMYSTSRDVNMATDSNHNLTIKADVHVSNSYPNVTNTSRNTVRTPNQTDHRGQPVLEPRSQTAYQTYLTEDLQVQSGNMFQRENSPNVCNNSKEDSSSNPDSGYSSKIYGNRASSATPASQSSTPSSSFSTDRGISIPSNNNSPQSQYSNGDYDSLPKSQYYDDVQSHMHNWYQRKLQETTQKVYDSWRLDQSPGKTIPNGRNRLPVRNYGKDDYAKIPYDFSQGVRSSQVTGQQIYGDYSGLNTYASTGQANSHIAMHGSDV